MKFKYFHIILGKMTKNAAIELSINTLVIIIISIVVLGAGITLLYKFIGGAEEIKLQLDQQTSEELERLMVDQGKQVALPFHVADVSRGDTHVFGIGILNIGGVGEQFTLDVTFNKVLDDQNNEITVSPSEVNTWLLYNKETLIIKENEHYKEGILINVPKDAVKGQYLFNARFFTENNKQYGNTQKFMVNVR